MYHGKTAHSQELSSPVTEEFLCSSKGARREMSVFSSPHKPGPKHAVFHQKANLKDYFSMLTMSLRKVASFPSPLRPVVD